MAVQILVDQSGAPPGVAGQAREDLVTGTPVQLTAVGGPYLAYQWSIVDRPVDVLAGVVSAAALSTPTAASTLYAPVDLAGTSLVQVVVDSGAGLGALPEDIARITFYCGPVLDPDPRRLPRRRPAFRETTEHNVPDLVFPGGNPRGWAQEWERWFLVIERALGGVLQAAARVSVPSGGPASLVDSFNVTSAVRVSQGVVDVSFTTPLGSATYAAVATPRGSGGMAYVDSEAPGSVRVYRGDTAGNLVDADFSLAVVLG